MGKLGGRRAVGKTTPRGGKPNGKKKT